MTSQADDAARILRGECCHRCSHMVPCYDGGADRSYLSCGVKQVEVEGDEWCAKFDRLTRQKLADMLRAEDPW